MFSFGIFVSSPIVSSFVRSVDFSIDVDACVSSDPDFDDYYSRNEDVILIINGTSPFFKFSTFMLSILKMKGPSEVIISQV